MTTAPLLPTGFDDSASGWERALYAFLAEKQRRSGSMRTVQSYSRMLQDFFGRLGKPPDAVTSQDVFAYAHGVGLSGREPSSVTVGARAACVSSFYRFLIRMGAATSNPCGALERPKVNPAQPRGLSADHVRKLLAVIPETPAGLRDRAIFLTLVLTGRRRSEVLNLRVGDLTVEGETVFYQYRGKGGKRGRRELPRPAYEAIVRALVAFGKDLASMATDESLWRAVGGEGGITNGTAYLRFRRYLKDAGLPLSGLHVPRHSAAKIAAGRRRVSRSGECLPRSLIAGGDDDLLTATRGAGGRWVGGGGRGDRGVIVSLGPVMVGSLVMEARAREMAGGRGGGPQRRPVAPQPGDRCSPSSRSAARARCR